MRRVSTVATGLVLAVLAVLGASQNPASFSGVITDTAGRGLPGARITLASEDRALRTTVTDSIGRYRLDGLTPGRYRIEASMAGFEAKLTETTLLSGQDVDWSGALLVGHVIGGTSIERQVMRVTGSEAIDCGRHSTSASEAALQRSLTCGLTSARARRPFSVILQFAAGDAQRGYGLLAGSDGVIHVFEYEKGGVRFRLQQCPSPQVTPRPIRPGAGFEFTCQVAVPI